MQGICQKSCFGFWFLVILLGATLAWAAAGEPVNFKQLLPLVKANLPGWEMDGEPRGATMKNPGIMFSEAEAGYKQGEKHFTIKIMDSPQAAMGFMGLSYAQGMEMESTEESIKGTKINGMPAVETYRPPVKEAKIDVLAANRFLVTVEGQGFESIHELKNLLVHFELGKLAELAN